MVAAVVNKFNKFAAGDEIAGECEVLEKDRVARAFVIKAKTVAFRADLKKTAVKIYPPGGVRPLWGVFFNLGAARAIGGAEGI